MRLLLVATLVLGWLGPARAQTFVMGWPAEPVQLDPAVVVDSASLGLTHQIYETLVRLRRGTTEIEPGLAERWEASPDGQIWTFHLRPDVRFHDGSPLDAAAVVWNFERWWKTAHPQHADQVRAGQTFEYWASQFDGFDDDAIVSEIEVQGARSLRLTLKRPLAPLLATLASPGFGIASPRAVARSGTAFGRHPVGTGPFRFVTWAPSQEVVLESNPGYWGARPKVARVVVRPIRNGAQRLAALQSGEIHGMEGLDPEALAVVRRDPDLYLLFRPPNTTGYVAFNYAVKELRDERIRRALAHAIDKRGLVGALYGETGLVAKTLQPPSFWGHDPELPDFEHDPEKARVLLAQAGFPRGLSEITWADGRREPLALWYMPVSRPYYPDPREIAEAIAADLAKVGIRARLQTVDWAVYLDRVRDGRLPLYMLGWIADNGDPDGALCYVFCAPGAANQGFYANARLAELLLRARSVTGRGERARLYRRAEAILHADVARLFIAHSRTPLAFSRRVTGYVPSPSGAESFDSVELR